jgi:hypothetical protein
MKLISMVAFTLQQTDKFTHGLPAPDRPMEVVSSIRLLRNYANFLNQLLTLGMFVPTDDEGNVLTEPMDYNFYCEGDWNRNENTNWQDECKQYQQAKSRVIFEEGLFVQKSSIENCINIGFTIEKLTTYDLTLTQSELKKLGL